MLSWNRVRLLKYCGVGSGNGVAEGVERCGIGLLENQNTII